jgi:hypothetical protein
VKKSRPRARERAQRTDLLSSRNWTTKAHNNYTMWDRTSGKEDGLFLDSQPILGPNQAGLFLDATVGPDQTEDRLFLVTVGGTKPRWAFLGQLCGTGPTQTQKKVGFSWTPLWNRPRQTRPDQTNPKQTRERWAFLRRPCGTRPDQTRPDRPKADAGEGGLFLDALVEPDHARPDQTRQTQSRRGRRWAFLGRPCGTRPDQTRPKVN